MNTPAYHDIFVNNISRTKCAEETEKDIAHILNAGQKKFGVPSYIRIIASKKSWTFNAFISYPDIKIHKEVAKHFNNHIYQERQLHFRYTEGGYVHGQRQSIQYGAKNCKEYEAAQKTNEACWEEEEWTPQTHSKPPAETTNRTHTHSNHADQTKSEIKPKIICERCNQKFNEQDKFELHIEPVKTSTASQLGTT